MSYDRVSTEKGTFESRKRANLGPWSILLKILLKKNSLIHFLSDGKFLLDSSQKQKCKSSAPLSPLLVFFWVLLARHQQKHWIPNCMNVQEQKTPPATHLEKEGDTSPPFVFGWHVFKQNQLTNQQTSSRSSHDTQSHTAQPRSHMNIKTHCTGWWPATVIYLSTL